MSSQGGLAKWLCSGLQIHLPRFDSGTRLHFNRIVLAGFSELKRRDICKSIYVTCPGGEIGRRKGLKIPRLHGRAGSIPALGTIFKDV